MSLTPLKTHTTARSYTYTYYITPPSSTITKPPILLLHGFPEYASMWYAQIKQLETLGHLCIAPNLLGYGPSSLPLETEAYNSSGLSQDLISLIDSEKVTNVIVIGHDWGSYLAGRFANWFPNRISGLVLTSVSYRPAGKLDLDASNLAMKGAFGYEPYGYWSYFAGKEAPKFLEEHVESLFSLLFAEDAEIWKTDFTPPGALQAWLLADRTVPTASFITPKDSHSLIAQWKSDGFAAKLGWYRAMTENIHWEHEKNIPAENFKLKMPVLFIGGSRDAPAPGVLGDLVTKPLCEDYTGTVLDSGHWVLRERPGEWMVAVERWLGEKF